MLFSWIFHGCSWIFEPILKSGKGACLEHLRVLRPHELNQEDRGLSHDLNSKALELMILRHFLSQTAKNNDKTHGFWLILDDFPLIFPSSSTSHLLC